MKNIVVLFLAAWMLSACSSITVQSDYDREANFAAYQTYALKVVPMEGFPEVLDDLTKNRVEKFIREEMAYRGYKEADAPDLYVTYGVRVDDKQKMVANTYYYNSPYYYGYWGGYNYGWSEIDVVDYKVGTLIIDIVDAERNRLVWYGAGSKVIDGGSRDPESTIKSAIGKIFRYYPGKAGTEVR
jgi:hypothetical protein